MFTFMPVANGLETFLEASFAVKAGLVLLVAATALLIAAISKVTEKKKGASALFVAALVLTVAGYVFADLKFVALNLRMRDPEAVRRACQQILKGERNRVLQGAEIPVALRKLGAVYVYASGDGVRVGVAVYDAASPCYYLYLPEGGTLFDSKGKKPQRMRKRGTPFRDIYVGRDAK